MSERGLLVDTFECPIVDCTWSYGVPRPTVKVSDAEIEWLHREVHSQWWRHVGLDHPGYRSSNTPGP